MRYLIITEDNLIYKTDELSDAEFTASEENYIAIIDMEEEKVHIRANEWEDIPSWKEYLNNGND